MQNPTPKGLRLHLGIFGRTNVGKSSFLNKITGQEVSIVSTQPGTTTDVVEKTMELLPLGPVVFLDTAGMDDESQLGKFRVEKTKNALERVDVVLLLVEANRWESYEDDWVQEAEKRKLPVLVLINKTDQVQSDENFMQRLKELKLSFLSISCANPQREDSMVDAFKQAVFQICPETFFSSHSLLGDLIPASGLAVLIVPIDLQAPKGRLILPQVQAIRDILDHDGMSLVVKEREYAEALKKLSQDPHLVICDSQVVQKMVADTPAHIPCTTFSILFSRFKGDLNEMVRGVKAIESLKSGDKVLIAEACTHHAAEDDIGSVKIPRWIKQYTGLDLQIDLHSGCDFPKNIEEYKWIVHCGACTLNRKNMLNRIELAKAYSIPMTNYGVCIAYIQGVLERSLSPFPMALSILKEKN